MEDFRMREDIHLYEPDPKVLQKMGEVILYAVVAPYGSGKDSIINWLTAHRPHQFAPVVGDTSRPPREGETDGTDYHFRSKADMIDDLQNGRFVQAVPGFMGDFYATRPEQYPTDKIAIKPIQAREMVNLKRLGFKNLKWLQVVPPSDEIWRSWQKSRKYKAKDLKQRNEEAMESYRLALMNPDTYFILNDRVEEAARRILQVADGKRPDDRVRARQAAVRNLEALKARAKE